MEVLKVRFNFHCKSVIADRRNGFKIKIPIPVLKLLHIFLIEDSPQFCVRDQGVATILLSYLLHGLDWISTSCTVTSLLFGTLARLLHGLSKVCLKSF